MRDIVLRVAGRSPRILGRTRSGARFVLRNVVRRSDPGASFKGRCPQLHSGHNWSRD